MQNTVWVLAEKGMLTLVGTFAWGEVTGAEEEEGCIINW